MAADLDLLLAHAAHLTRRCWLDALPPALLDLWWSRGDADRTYAVLALGGPAEAALRRSWYAAVDADRSRASKIARAAIADVATDELATLGGRLAHLGDEVRAALVARDPRWTALEEVTPLAQLDDPRVRVAAIARSPTAEARASLAALWAHGGANPDDEEDVVRRRFADPLALALATHALDAWDLVPVVQRPAICSTAVLVGAVAQVERWIAEAAERTALEMMTSIASLHEPPRAWHRALRAAADETDADHAAGMITDGERRWRRWAALACDAAALGAATVEAIVDARAAATAFGTALGQAAPPAITNLRDRVMASVERPHGDLAVTLGMIARAGDRGELVLVREAIDRLEALRGRLTVDDRSFAAAIAHYPGRSRELLSCVPVDDFPRIVARTCAALARDGHADDAARYATALLSRPVGGIDRDALEVVARVVLDDGAERERLARVVAAALAALPGETHDDARRWLAAPAYASMS